MPDAVEAEMADRGGGCGLRRLDVDGFLEVAVACGGLMLMDFCLGSTHHID